MSEDIDKRVLKKYEIRQKLGKGVRRPDHARFRPHAPVSPTLTPARICRRTASFGRLSTRRIAPWLPSRKSLTHSRMPLTPRYLLPRSCFQPRLMHVLKVNVAHEGQALTPVDTAHARRRCRSAPGCSVSLTKKDSAGQVVWTLRRKKVVYSAFPSARSAASPFAGRAGTRHWLAWTLARQHSIPCLYLG